MLIAITPARAKDLALVANKSSNLGEVSMADLTKMCKAQTPRWPDGKPVSVVLREPSSPDMRIMLEKVYNITPEALQELIRSANHGRADRAAIIVAGSDEEIIRKVASLPGAIGLVDVYSITGAVNVVKIGGKLPLESGYPLHGN